MPVGMNVELVVLEGVFVLVAEPLLLLRLLELLDGGWWLIAHLRDLIILMSAQAKKKGKPTTSSFVASRVQRQSTLTKTKLGESVNKNANRSSLP